jgi:membrane-associated phospholipid phosphatase
VLSLTTLLFAADARADEVRELKTDIPVDVAFTGTAIGLVLWSELGKLDLVPDECRWCGGDALDDRVRDALLWDKPSTAALLSDANGFILAPTTAFATLAGAASHDGASRKTATDMLIVLEAGATSALLNQIVKYTVARERPYGRYKTPLSPSPTADARLSFFSGHTSLTFTLAAAAGTVAHLRGYRLAPITWIPGAAIAAFTGYLRIAADKHYLTDVLVGAAVGSAVGILVPLVFHPRTDAIVTPGPAAPASAPPSMQVMSIGGGF